MDKSWLVRSPRQGFPSPPSFLLEARSVGGRVRVVEGSAGSSLHVHVTLKPYSVYEQSAHQMTALLSEVILFLVTAACELRSVSYGSKHVTDSFLYTILCVLARTTWKLKVVWHSTYWITALLSEVSIPWVRAVGEIWLASYRFKHALQPLSKLTFCAHLTVITRKLPVVYRRCTLYVHCMY